MNNETWSTTATRRPDQERATCCEFAAEHSDPPRTINGVRQQITGSVRIRNVAEKRAADGHFAHFEISVDTHYSSRSNYAGASLALTREDAIDAAAALLGVNRDVVVSMVEGIHG